MLKSEILIRKNGDLLAKTFVEHFAQLAMHAVGERGRFLVVLSGGGTPLKAYNLLAKSPLCERVPWQHTHLFWGDERHVPQGDPESNFRQASEALLAYVNIPEGNIHPIPTDLPPGEAATAYEQILLSYTEAGQPSARFDLVMLGLGNDGHTASLFPGQSAKWQGLVVTTEGNYEGRPATRITLTPQAFNQAREIVFLVSGASKTNALSDAWGKVRDENRYPSQMIQPSNGKLLWMVDQEAMGNLVGKDFFTSTDGD